MATSPQLQLHEAFPGRAKQINQILGFMGKVPFFSSNTAREGGHEPRLASLVANTPKDEERRIIKKSRRQTTYAQVMHTYWTDSSYNLACSFWTSQRYSHRLRLHAIYCIIVNNNSHTCILTTISRGHQHLHPYLSMEILLWERQPLSRRHCLLSSGAETKVNRNNNNNIAVVPPAGMHSWTV